MKHSLILCLLALFFVGCSVSGFKDFYHPWYNEDYFPVEAYLTKNEEPVLIQTSDIDTKFREISSHWYWCIGQSDFNGSSYSNYKVYKSIVNLSKENKAKIAVWSKTYIDTQTGVYSVPHTSFNTHIDLYGNTHSYATTSFSTHAYSVNEYNYSVYLFIPIPPKYRTQYAPGFYVSDLTQSDREQYKQNTGCVINVVFEGTPAYYANLLHGDVIAKINNKRINNRDDFFKMQDSTKIGDIWKMVIIRNGKTLRIALKYGI